MDITFFPPTPFSLLFAFGLHSNSMDSCGDVSLTACASFCYLLVEKRCSSLSSRDTLCYYGWKVTVSDFRLCHRHFSLFAVSRSVTETGGISPDTHFSHICQIVYFMFDIWEKKNKISLTAPLICSFGVLLLAN